MTEPRGLVFGGTGRLGSALRRADPSLIAPGRAALDLEGASRDDIVEAVSGAAWVINAAAAAGVDDCERDPVGAHRINAEAPERIARACRAAGVDFLHISTDYVFGGRRGPYAEGAAPCPVQAYGRSKAGGEAAVLAAGGAVARVSWLFDDDGGPFQRWVLGQTGPAVEIHTDQRSRPTPLPGLARWLLAVADRLPDAPRILHAAGGPPASRAQWARAILDARGRSNPVVPQRSTPLARRPNDSVLDPTATDAWADGAGVPRIPDWRDLVGG